MFYILMVLFKLKFYISSFDYNCGMETVSKLTQARLLSPGYCMYTSELTRIHTQQSDANGFKVQGWSLVCFICTGITIKSTENCLHPSVFQAQI